MNTTKQTIKFTIGGAVYNVPPLRWFWQEDITEDVSKVFNVFVDLASRGKESDIEIAASFMKHSKNIIDPALKIVAKGMEQVKFDENTEGPTPTLLELKQALLPEEIYGIFDSVSAWTALQNPSPKDNAMGEATAAAANASNLGTEVSNPS